MSDYTQPYNLRYAVPARRKIDLTSTYTPTCSTAEALRRADDERFNAVPVAQQISELPTGIRRYEASTKPRVCRRKIEPQKTAAQTQIEKKGVVVYLLERLSWGAQIIAEIAEGSGLDSRAIGGHLILLLRRGLVEKADSRLIKNKATVVWGITEDGRKFLAAPPSPVITLIPAPRHMGYRNVLAGLHFIYPTAFDALHNKLKIRPSDIREALEVLISDGWAFVADGGWQTTEKGRAAQLQIADTKASGLPGCWAHNDRAAAIADMIRNFGPQPVAVLVSAFPAEVPAKSVRSLVNQLSQKGILVRSDNSTRANAPAIWQLAAEYA